MKKPEPKPESPVTSLLINIVIPVCILTFLSKDKYLGPVWALVIAVAFPVTHGIKTLIRERKADVLAIIGMISVLLTGIFGILELPPEWVARKEAAVPLIIGLIILICVHWVIRQTTMGYQIRVLFANRKVAIHTGMNVRNITVWCFLVSGGLCGLAGASDVLAIKGLFQAGWNPMYGMTCIPLVFLARLNGGAVIPLACFFSFLAVTDDDFLTLDHTLQNLGKTSFQFANSEGFHGFLRFYDFHP